MFATKAQLFTRVYLSLCRLCLEKCWIMCRAPVRRHRQMCVGSLRVVSSMFSLCSDLQPKTSSLSMPPSLVRRWMTGQLHQHLMAFSPMSFHDKHKLVHFHTTRDVDFWWTYQVQLSVHRQWASSSVWEKAVAYRTLLRIPNMSTRFKYSINELYWSTEGH